MAELKLIGRIPSKKNSRITTRTGRSFPSKNYTIWHKDAEVQVQESGIKPFETNNLAVTIDFSSPDRRKYDLTNKAESVMDLLVDCGIIIDDNFDIVPTITLNYCGVEKGGLAIVNITQLNDEEKITTA